MTYKQIETSREIRLWIGQIIVPAVATVGTVMAMNPELREKAKNKMSEVKNKFKTRNFKVIK